MSAAVAYAAPSFTTHHGDRRFRVGGAVALAAWRDIVRRHRHDRKRLSLVVSPAQSLSIDDLRAIEAAVASVCRILPPVDRRDLWQELAIKLLDERPEDDLRAWLRRCAHNWVMSFWRERRRERSRDNAMKQNAPVPQWQRGENWFPKWYPPHPDAIEYRGKVWHGQAWLACEGARVMHCKHGQRGKSED